MENYLEKNWKQYFEDLRNLIKIPSFIVTKEDYPNEHHREALAYMENLAKANGMKVFTNPEGYYGYIEIGVGEEMIGLLAHLDVVAPGDLKLWNTDPFELIEEDDKLIGRGTNDDKGPLLVSFYLFKELLEKKTPLNKRIRLIYATDEESFSRGIAKYLENGEEEPAMGWTPDTFFPPIYGEKAIFQYKLSLKEDLNFELNGGTGLNTVSPRATYKGEKVAEVKAKMDELGFKYELNNDGSLSAIGVPVHAKNAAFEGTNANARLIKAVSMVENSKFLNFIAKYIGTETTGDTLFNRHYEDETGAISCNIGLIKINADETAAYIDTRIPIFATNWEDVEKEIIINCNKENIVYEQYRVLEKKYVDKNGSFIQTLLQAYKDVTKEENAKPTIIGGGTYARSMKNIVGFGPNFNDSPKTLHEANEYTLKSHLIKAYSIYAHAFEMLLK